MDYSYVRGFSYQPGYARNSYEAWRFYDPEDEPCDSPGTRVFQRLLLR